MDYLEISQNIRREIESLPGIESKLKNMLEGKAEPFTHGSSVDLYRVGKTSSDLYVALRAFNSEFLEDECIQSLEDQIQWMENYCQNIEMHNKHKEDVPKFCIGVIYQNKATLLTEDLTQNECCKVTPLEGGDVEVTVTGPGVNRKRVYVDVDPHYIDLRPIPESRIKYFADPNVIRLDNISAQKERDREPILISTS